MSLVKKKLGEICVIEKGTTGIQKAIPGEYPLVVTSEERKSHNEFQFDDEAVIIPLVSGTGHGHASIKRIHFQKGKFALGSILCAVIPKNKTQLSAEYLYRFLCLNKENELVSRMRGMANVTLPIKEIAQVEIPLPTLMTQLEFVEKYKIIEAKSDLLETELIHQVALIKKMRQQLLQDAISGKLTVQDPKDEDAHELLKKITVEKELLIKENKLKKEKKLRPIRPGATSFDIPASWRWCRLGEILTEIKYGTSQSCDYDSAKNSKVIRIPNVSSGILNGEDLKYTNLSPKEKQALALDEDDILIIRSNGSRELVGKTVLVTKKFIGYSYAGYLVRWRYNKILTNPKFLLFATASPFFRELIETPLRTTVGINNINTQEMSDLIIPLPPIREQGRIIQRIEQFISVCNDLENNINKTVSQNEKLLQQVLKETLQSKVEETSEIIS